MKNRNTKERRRDREEFVYRHRETIKAILSGTKMAVDIHSHLFVEATVLNELPYSPKTSKGDIWCSLVKTYKKMFPK